MTPPDPSPTPHFVVKKGHRGRYRFTLMLAGNRVTGEVNTMTGWNSRTAQDAKALAEIGALAATLLERSRSGLALHDLPVRPDQRSEDPEPGGVGDAS